MPKESSIHLRLILTFLILLSSFVAISAEVRFSDFITPEFTTSANSLSAGNATLTNDTGIRSVFMNPAARLPIRGHGYSFISADAEYNPLSYDESVGRRGISPRGFDEAVSFIRLSKMNNVLRERGRGVLHQKLNFISHYQYKQFSVGYFTAFESNGVLNNSESDFVGNRRKDAGIFLHSSYRLKRNLLLGLTYTYLERSEELSTIFNDPASPEALAFNGRGERRGTMHNLILGFKYKLPRLSRNSRSLLQLGGVVRNLFGANFSGKSGSSTPERIPMSFDTGLSYKPSRRSAFSAEVTLRDLTGSYSEVSLGRKLQIGTRYQFKKSRYFIQLGLLDTYLTCGIGGRIWKRLSGSFASYASNLSETGVVQEDRRFVFQFSI